MKILEEGDLDRLRRQTLIYAALSAWCGRGIFEALSDGKPRSADELGISSRALEVTGQVMLELGLAECSDSGWSLSPGGAALQAQGVLDLSGPEALFGSLAKLDQSMCTGEPARLTEIGVVDSDPEHTRTFLEMLYRRSATSADSTAELLSPLLPPAARVLDLGGGHGRYGEALRQRCDARITLLDRPVAVGLAQDRYGASQDYISGDFMHCDLGGAYDAVLLSNIVHGLGPDELSVLFRRLAKCIAQGGQIVLKDMFVGGGCDAEVAVAFGMQMLLATRAGRSYSVEQITSLLGAGGFETPVCHPVPSCGFSLLVAGLTAV